MTAGARLPKYKGFSATRPPDITDDRWQAALRGLQRFVAGGWAEKAEAAGWTRDELYAAPPLWARVDLCGAALLIGDREVISVMPTEIRIKATGGATQAFCRKPKVDYALVFRERLKQLGGDAGKEEVQLRALEHTVNVFRANHPGADIDAAKTAVLAAITTKGTQL